ncbi:MAG: hypothetical protein U0521_25010 [Anaerolineae bacterium]
MGFLTGGLGLQYRAGAESLWRQRAPDGERVGDDQIARLIIAFPAKPRSGC